MTILKSKIEWHAQHLMCDQCGKGEMRFVFRVKKPKGSNIFLHTCDECGSCSEEEVQYPNPVWEEA